MALVKCPDCGHDVSTAASACPNCGRPMAAMAAPTPQTAPPVKEETLWHGTPSWLLLFGKVVLAFVVAIVLILIYYFGYQFLAPYGTIVWIVIAVVMIWPIAAILIDFARINTTLYP